MGEWIMLKTKTNYFSAYDKLERGNLLVKEMMTRDPVTVTQSATLGEVEQLMQRKAIRHIPVVDEQNRILGIVSHRDILRFSVSELPQISHLDRDIAHFDISVSNIMQTEVETVTPQTTLRTAAILMAEKKYGCLPVIENARLIGMITEGDFLRFFSDGV